MCGGRSKPFHERLEYLLRCFDLLSESCEKPLMGDKYMSDMIRFSF